MLDEERRAKALCCPRTESRAGMGERAEGDKEALPSDAAIAGLPLQVGLEYAQSDMLAEAERWLRLALTFDPEHCEALTSLGDVLRRQGRLAEAMAMLEAAVQLAPESSNAHLNLGIARGESGQLAEAASGRTGSDRLTPARMRATTWRTPRPR